MKDDREPFPLDFDPEKGFPLGPGEPIRNREDMIRINAFDADLSTKLQELADAGLERQAVEVVFNALHARLTSYQNRIPYGEDMEDLVRGMIAIVSGSENGDYIADQLRGISVLAIALYRHMPSFAESVKDEPLLQAILGKNYRPE